ncbi:transcription termination factor NusA [Metamycoplasma auris]|uniref:Transcription termination/antitermination protein NusA n=1 Tax=Metamycoplasma auris TaxID=51363 RepID=A0A2W7G4P2_9BACT|nr:transcription termination factor NusA [Metamycoplasma auris]PZW01552.1 NusA antitermination factor [Metamycoplasma auris]
MGIKSNIINTKSNEIFNAIYNVSKIKNIDEELVIKLLKAAVEQVIVGQYDPDAELEFIIDKDNREFRVINHTKIVTQAPKTDDEKDNFCPCIEITVEEAKKIDPNIEEGDLISAEIDFERFAKKDYQKILSIFNQQIRELEKQLTYQKYVNLVGDVVKAKITNITKNGTLMELHDGVVAYMPSSTTNLRLLENLRPGDLIDVYIEEVKQESKNAQVIVSSIESKLLNKLIAQEIPEVAAGYIELVRVVRIPGERAKVAIKKSEFAPFGLEELGSIIGKNSERIEAISKQLNGEKIDLILYDEDKPTFVMNAIAPARVIDIIHKEDSRADFNSFLVIVPNAQHTLAIGRRGQNVKLASELTKVRLDIISQAQADQLGIKYTFDNANISEEEAQLKYEGKKLHYKSFSRPQKRKDSLFDYSFNISEFDEDLAELRQKASQTEKAFEKHLSDTNIDDEIEKALEEIQMELNNSIDDDLDIYSEDINKKEEKNKEKIEADYEKITSTKMKDFKRDADLSAGLEDLDLSDLDNEDW